MERRKFIKHAGIAGILAAGVAPAAHAQGATIRWRLASSFPKALDTIFGAADVFSKKLKEMSGGKFEISVHAGGEIMPPFGVVDGVQQGTVECAHTAPYYFGSSGNRVGKNGHLIGLEAAWILGFGHFIGSPNLA